MSCICTFQKGQKTIAAAAGSRDEEHFAARRRSGRTQMRAYKREIQKLEDVGTHYYAKAMQGEIESAHVYARINERYCAMQGWSSVNIRLDPYAAQVKEQPSQHEQIRDAIFRLKYGPQWKPSDSFGADARGPPSAKGRGRLIRCTVPGSTPNRDLAHAWPPRSR
jgi:hypothetical protein